MTAVTVGMSIFRKYLVIKGIGFSGKESLVIIMGSLMSGQYL